jgi:hypothetical protein
MTSQQSSDLVQLTETVARLSEALAASERRHAAIARTVRWGALGLVIALGAALYAASDWMQARAAQLVPPGYLDGMERQMAVSPPQLDKVLQSLMGTDKMDGALVKVLQSAGMVAMMETQAIAHCVRDRDASGDQNKLCYAPASVQDLGEYFFSADGKPVEPPPQDASEQEQMAYAQKMMAATMMAMGQVVVDAGTLLHRLRRDSDQVRGLFAAQGIAQTLEGVRTELDKLNLTLTAVPAMAGQMDVMNRHMSSMAYSMGSTMGRMGNILPW